MKVTYKWCRRCMDDQIKHDASVCPSCGHDFLWSVGPKGQVWYGEYQEAKHEPEPLPASPGLPVLRELSDEPTDDLRDLPNRPTQRNRVRRGTVSKSPRKPARQKGAGGTVGKRRGGKA